MRRLRDSFVPLVAVFVAASVMLIWAQYVTREHAEHVTTIHVRARDDTVDPDESEDEAITAPVFVGAAPDLEQGTSADHIAQFGMRARAEGSLDLGAWADLVALHLIVDNGQEAREITEELDARGLGLPDGLRRQQPAREAAALAFNLGIAFWRGRDFDLASRYLEIADALDSRWQSQVAHGLVLVRSGERRGESVIKRALRAVPEEDQGRVWFALGSARSKAGDDAAAKAAYEQALELDPAMSAARLNLAVLQAQSGKLEEAEETYQELLRNQPDYFRAHYNYSILLERMGRRQDAISALRNALVYRPDHIDAREKLAGLLLDVGRPDDARRQYEWLQQRSPGDARYLFELGRCAWRQKKYDEAERRYREAIRKNGGNYPEAWVNLGLVHKAMDDPDQAEADYRAALRLDPAYAGAQRRLGDLLEDRGDLEGAVVALEAAVASDPKDAGAWRELASVREDLGDADGALGAWEHALQLVSDDASTWNQVGILRADEGDDAGAVQAYQRALSVDPKNATVWFNLGLARRRLDEDDAAIEAFQRAAELAAQDDASGVALKAHRSAGHVYRVRRDYEEALPHYRRAVEIRADDATSRYYVAHCLYKLEKYDEAANEIEKLVSLKPGNVRAWRLARRIAQRRGDDAAELAANMRIKELE